MSQCSCVCVHIDIDHYSIIQSLVTNPKRMTCVVENCHQI